ncbi:MAG: pyrrolysine--tRNA(Pyl) ligase small subunit [Candidatus Adiutrix sp.]
MKTVMLENANLKPVARRYYRKKIDLFTLLNKMKLWPSRTGVLHGLKNIERHGDMATLTTHCGLTFKVRNSRKSRAARWLRNKLYQSSCSACIIPQWKLDKYGATFFSRRHGSLLSHDKSF